MKAYAYGSEVQILAYYMNEDGLDMCKVRCIDAGWVLNIPTSMIDIRS